jgi:hypothetical protein
MLKMTTKEIAIYTSGHRKAAEDDRNLHYEIVLMRKGVLMSSSIRWLPVVEQVAMGRLSCNLSCGSLRLRGLAVAQDCRLAGC